MRRRDFVTLLGGSAIAWPLAVQAQHPAMPVIGYLGIRSAESDASRLTGLRRGLNDTGYVEGRNLTIEYRWGGNQPDRLPALVAELIHELSPNLGDGRDQAAVRRCFQCSAGKS